MKKTVYITPSTLITQINTVNMISVSIQRRSDGFNASYGMDTKEDAWADEDWD